MCPNSNLVQDELIIQPASALGDLKLDITVNLQIKKKKFISGSMSSCLVKESVVSIPRGNTFIFRWFEW